jgi:preprotein translocase subunit YajC
MFISEAYAQAAAPGGMDLLQMAPIVVMFALLYFLMIRPQMKRQKEVASMLAGLKKGDEVVAAGILGKILDVGDAYVSVEIGKGTVIQVQKSAITMLLPNGTIKAAS